MSKSKSLHNLLVNSHLRIAGLATAFLIICVGLLIFMQRDTAAIAEQKLPLVISATEALSGINNTVSRLRATVIQGGNLDPEIESLWQLQVRPSIEQLQKLKTMEPENYSALIKKLNALEESQWWIEDLSGAAGNYPANRIYENDVLSSFLRIESALGGLENYQFRNASEIRLLASIAHQELTNALRLLSECVRSGSSAEIQNFRESSTELRGMLAELSEQIDVDSDARSLLDWILREYQVYESAADQTIALRQSEDWNRALKILATETEPLAADIHAQLSKVQERQSAQLMTSALDTQGFAGLSVLINLSMIAGLALFAFYLARLNADSLANPIMDLAKASDALAKDPQVQVNMPTQGSSEVLHLADRFLFMSQELSKRRGELLTANSELEEYTHIITHDLKAPLTNINGHAGLIREQLNDLAKVDRSNEALGSYMREEAASRVSESLGFIETSITRTSLLVNGILDKSTLLFHKLDMRDTDLQPVVERTLSLFNYALTGVETKNNVSAQVVTDVFFLEHILINLIDNAIKYLEPDRLGVISVTNETTESFVILRVEDNGIGIDDSRVDVFRLFQQGDPRNEGSGLGLALTRTMVKKLGGTITYRPNTPHGTIFEFTLPLRQ